MSESEISARQAVLDRRHSAAAVLLMTYRGDW